MTFVSSLKITFVTVENNYFEGVICINRRRVCSDRTIFSGENAVFGKRPEEGKKYSILKTYRDYFNVHLKPNFTLLGKENEIWHKHRFQANFENDVGKHT